MTDDEEERLLVLRVQQGDIAAFESILRRLHKPLRNYVTRMVGELIADDVLQEISWKIYQQIRFLREPTAFRAWVYRIASRIALVHLGREKRWRSLEEEAHDLSSASSTAFPEDGEMESELLALVDRVSPASRAILLLHYQQNLSLEETAVILDLPLGTVKSRLAYGITTLRKFFKEKETK